jgi:hypothetical protein
MDSAVPNRHNKRYIGIHTFDMILARYNLAAPNSEPLKIPVLGVLALSALGVSSLCAAAVFLFLLAGEQHATDTGSTANTVSNAALAAVNPSRGINPPQSQQIPAAEHPKVAPIEFERTDFSVLKSRSYRSAGPVRIRLLRTRKNETCDIAVLINNKRTKRLGATVGTAIDIGMPGSLPHASVVLTGIANNRVWGYVRAPKSTAKNSVGINPAGQASHRGS